MRTWRPWYRSTWPRTASRSRWLRVRSAASPSASGAFQAVLLDVMLPDLDGFEVCRRIRARADTPVLMLTARGDDTDRIVGLELGADDYLPKPFNPRELLARLKAILRRTTEPDGDEPVEIAVGDLRVNLRRREAWLGESTLKLTNAEFVILV